MHIGWSLCDRLCPVLVCRGRCGLRGGVLFFILGSNLGGVGPERGLRGGGRRGGVRSGPGAARTILLFHIISARPSKHPLMVRTFLKLYMGLGSYFLFLQEQLKDIIIWQLASVKYKDYPNWWTHSLLREGYGKDKHWVLLGLPSHDSALSHYDCSEVC